MTMVIPAGAVQGERVAHPAEAMRQSGPAELEAALTAGRARLLALFAGFERALGSEGLHIAFDPVLNLPVWELGHIGWFEEHWLGRNTDRRRGRHCDPVAPRLPSFRLGADALHDSSKVPHAQRWQLALPDPEATRDYLARVRDSTLSLLQQCAWDDDALYFFRLVLFHEDMHREAWHFMAQRLGIDLGEAMLGRTPRAPAAHGDWQIGAGWRSLGASGAGFAFDNELAASRVFVDAFAIDIAPVTWARYLPFIEAGGYQTEALWSADGWAWRQHHQCLHPRHLRRSAQGWEQQRFGSWSPVDPAAPALHLSAHEAAAWCRWAGRRLPTEAEWEAAALLARENGQAFEWGQVWEWTASPFAPYPGFVPHPYRDYSQPWFDGRPVLRGASFATAPHMKHPSYRNFFPAHRNDVFAGFRSCAVAQVFPEDQR